MYPRGVFGYREQHSLRHVPRWVILICWRFYLSSVRAGNLFAKEWDQQLYPLRCRLNDAASRPDGSVSTPPHNAAVANEGCPAAGLKALTWFFLLTSAVCDNCTAGSFAPLDGEATCTLCDKGSYSALDGASYCELCTGEEYQDEVGRYRARSVNVLIMTSPQYLNNQ